jgi:methionyl-tRNA formyltransferase
MGLRVIFMGTPDFSVPVLEAIHAAGHEIVAVYSQPPRPAGRRGLELKKSPVQQKAEALGLSVHTPKSLKAQEQQSEFSAHDADVAIVVAYGLLLPKAILDAPRLGCFNGHASLLPRWRGAAPIQRAIMAGDSETGMMVMKMDEGLDTGDVALSARVKITPDMTAGQLHDALSSLGATLMVEALEKLEDGVLDLKPQPEDGVLYAKKIDKAEARIDWSKSASDVHNLIRGLSPFPGTWCEMAIGGKLQRVKILQSRVIDGNGENGEVLGDQLTIACGPGAIQPVRLQKAGSKAMDRASFLVGNTIAPGSRIT